MRLKKLLALSIISIFIVAMYGCMAPTKTGEVVKKTSEQQTETKKIVEGIDQYEPNNTTERATAIQVETEIEGTIYRQGDEDFYKFTIDATLTKNISIEMTNPGGRLEPAMIVHAPDGTKVRVTPKKRGADLITEIAAISGGYFVEISDQKRGQSSKPYVLKVTTEEKTKEEKSSGGIEFNLE